MNIMSVRCWVSERMSQCVRLHVCNVYNTHHLSQRCKQHHCIGFSLALFHSLWHFSAELVCVRYVKYVRLVQSVGRRRLLAHACVGECFVCCSALCVRTYLIDQHSFILYLERCSRLAVHVAVQYWCCIDVFVLTLFLSLPCSLFLSSSHFMILFSCSILSSKSPHRYLYNREPQTTSMPSMFWLLCDTQMVHIRALRVCKYFFLRFSVCIFVLMPLCIACEF